VRLSEFWFAMNEQFGEAYARVIVRDVALAGLNSRTGEEALAAGVPVKDVWLAICEALDVPLSRRHGVGQRKPTR
jgi:hypothetical protein